MVVINVAVINRVRMMSDGNSGTTTTSCVE